MEIANFRGEIKKNEPLSKHTSFGIGGPADQLAFPVDREDLVALLAAVKKQKLPYFILGGGTNLLVRDGGFRGIVISLKRMGTIKIEREYRSVGGSYCVIAAEAGVPLPKLHFFATEQGLTGLEFATGIPGTVGGAIYMNAGTSAGEIGDITESVTLLTPEGELITRTKDEMKFGYRTSQLLAGEVVVEARFALRREDREKIQARIKDLLEKRKLQPTGHPSAGSVFKNPYEQSAGVLIDSAKLKGKKVGGAQVSDKHANFIVNVGNAKAKDVLALMEIVKETVLDVHGVRLEPEIKIIGED